MAELNETTYEHEAGGDTFTVTAAERSSIAMIRRLKAQRPSEVEITHTNGDGSLVARLPYSWMRVVPKRTDTLTDEQREARRQQGRALRRAQLGVPDREAAPNEGL